MSLALRRPELAEQPTSPVSIDVRGLTKRYGELAAVDGIDFSVGQGEIFAFLGPNGAGKSTTIKMLCTLAHPTSGRATVAGFDVVSMAKSVRRHIGLVFQEQTLDDQLTAEENLRFHAVLYGVPHRRVESRISRVMELNLALLGTRLFCVQLRRVDRGRCAIVHLQLSKERGRVVLHGVLREEHVLVDLAIGLAFRDEVEDAPLLGRE